MLGKHIAFTLVASYFAVFGSFLECRVNAQDSTDESAPQQLRWKFAEGDIYDVELTQSSSNQSEINNRRVSTDQNVIVELQWTVDSVDRNNARMSWQFSRVYSKFSTIKLQTQGAGGESPVPDTVEFDTAAEKPQKLAARKLWESVKPLVGQPFKVTMNDQGEVTGVSIPDETLELLRDLPGSMRIRQLMTEDGIKDVLGRTSITLPQDEVSKGYQWSTDRSFEIPLGRISQSTEYSYQGAMNADKNHHLIEVNSTASIGSYVEDGRPKLEIDSQQSSGQLIFDVGLGMMKSGSINSMMKTTTPYRDMEIKASMNSELGLKIEKRKL